MQYDPEVYATWSYDQVLIEIEQVIADTVADFPDVGVDDIAHDTILSYLREVHPEVGRELARCQLGMSEREFLAVTR